MIGYLTGSIYSIETDGNLILLTNGVGYQVQTPKIHTESFRVGDSLELFIHTHAREDALELFGFKTAQEKKIFLLLTSVSGIGPRTGLQIMSQISAEKLLEAIVHEDKAVLTSLSGIGKKTAERLLLDLTDKARKFYDEMVLGAAVNSSPKTTSAKGSIPQQGAYSGNLVMKQAVDAMISLGYKDQEAWYVVKESITQLEEQSSEDSADLQKIIRKSLQRMAQK